MRKADVFSLLVVIGGWTADYLHGSFRPILFVLAAIAIVLVYWIENKLSLSKSKKR